MKIKITSKKSSLDKFLAKLSLILFGIFLTSLIFAILIRYFGETGIYLGLVISIILIFCGFYYIEKGTKLRLVTWVMLITIIALTILFLVGMNFLSKSLEGF